MAAKPACPDRTFSLSLASWLETCYGSYLFWLHHLLERLGNEHVLSLWQQVHHTHDDGLVLQILGKGWHPCVQTEADSLEGSVAAWCAKSFPVAVEGVNAEEAKDLVESMPPIHQIRETMDSVHICKEITAFEALHLRFDGLALLCEALICAMGKQGELIAFDIVREERIGKAGGKTGSVAEFITDFISEPQEASLFTAGLEIEILSVLENEVFLHVVECEWARYFRERHPQVGYLLACSTDEAAYRAFNKNLRLQRTTTLMEGGKVCDFRIFVVNDIK